VYGYRWLLGLIYPYAGGVRASRLSARMVERAYRELEGIGYSRTTLRTLNLVLAKAFVEQVGRTLGARKPQIGHLISSTLLDAGYGVHEVAERLGHDPATLMRYYTRVNATRRLQAADRIAEFMTASEVRPRSLQTGVAAPRVFSLTLVSPSRCSLRGRSEAQTAAAAAPQGRNRARYARLGPHRSARCSPCPSASRCSRPNGIQCRSKNSPTTSRPPGFNTRAAALSTRAGSGISPSAVTR
jgi:hypothetical protein